MPRRRKTPKPVDSPPEQPHHDTSSTPPPPAPPSSSSSSAPSIPPPSPAQAPQTSIAPPPPQTSIAPPPPPPPPPSESLSQQLQQIAIFETPPPASTKGISFKKRPGFGSSGSKCLVKANHFLAELPNKDLHQYDVSIKPESTSRAFNRVIMNELVRLYRSSGFGNRLPAYDGRKSIYTAGPLPFQSREFEIEGPESTSSGSTTKFKVSLKFAARPSLHHLGEFLKGRTADVPYETLQVLDIVLRELPTQRFVPVGRSFFSPELARRRELGDGIESWRGFYQSIRPTQMGLSLNIDMSSTAFLEPLQVSEFVSKLLGKEVVRLGDAERIKVKKALRGVRVEVTHRGDIKRKYRIIGLTAEPTQELTFVNDKAEVKSVVQYFKETYGYIIRNPALPCLQVGNLQRPNYLPMEVCRIVDGQRYSKRLNDRQITALLKVTCQRPVDRERDIVQTVNQNDYPQDPYAKEFGIRISNRMAEVPARVLPAPKLKYHETGGEAYCEPRIGQWNMINKKVINGAVISAWACINFSRSVPENVAHEFCQELCSMCEVSGMTFNRKPAIRIQTARPDQVEMGLKKVLREFKQNNPNKNLQLLIAILPDNNGSLYGDLKRICETDLGIVSQCCLTKHVFKKSKAYLANVALKINVKAGGRNNALADCFSRGIPFVTDKPTIIFGADVTHPQPGEDSSPSIAAVVASQDWPEVTKYAGLVCAQEHRVEIIQDLFKEWKDPVRGTQYGGMIRELLISFRQATNVKPHRIIFYRDGVSESQFYQVLLYELDAIRKACASLEQDYQPPVTFIVVQKRHHTRLFAANHGDRRTVDGSGNILPGTVVDTKICHPTDFDFYLCSHAGIQGTSRPAHYQVLWDENNFTADTLQSLTNNLCYTYARCTRSVSFVPPAYYAHLAAFRARCYMELESDSGSGTGPRATRSSGSRTSTVVARSSVQSLPLVKDNVKRVMFFC